MHIYTIYIYKGLRRKLFTFYNICQLNTVPFIFSPFCNCSRERLLMMSNYPWWIKLQKKTSWSWNKRYFTIPKINRKNVCNLSFWVTHKHKWSDSNLYMISELFHILYIRNVTVICEMWKLLQQWCYADTLFSGLYIV